MSWELVLRPGIDRSWLRSSRTFRSLWSAIPVYVVLAGSSEAALDLMDPEPPRVAEATVHSIGFEWDLKTNGSDPLHEAVGNIRYRELGSLKYSEAELLRVDHAAWYRRCMHADCCSSPKPQKCIAPKDIDLTNADDELKVFKEYFEGCPGDLLPIGCAEEEFNLEQTVETSYRKFDMFAGSLMFLKPATNYEVELRVCDSRKYASCTETEHCQCFVYDDLNKEILPHTTTRSEPKALPQTAPQFHVVGDITRPVALTCNDSIDKFKTKLCMSGGLPPASCTNICDGSSEQKGFPGFEFAEWKAQPGSQFLVHEGEYNGHEFVERGDAGNPIAWSGFKPQAGSGSSTSDYRPLVQLSSSLRIAANHLRFEGMHLTPTVTKKGALDGIVGVTRQATCGPLSLYATPGSCENCSLDPALDLHCDEYGATDIAIVRNSFRDFKTAIGTGFKPCGAEFKIYPWMGKYQSIGGSRKGRPCLDDDPVDEEGAVWGDLASNPRLADRHRRDMHRHWYIADNQIYGGINPVDLIYASFIADSDIAYNHIDMIGCVDGPCAPDTKHEPDPMFVTFASNLDIYGNDIRDTNHGAANAIQADWSYSNLRIWRNRAINTGSQFVAAQTMASAPWYVVRNEYVSTPGKDPFQLNVTHRLVVVNNTFVIRGTQSAEGRADLLLLRSQLRNNLWMTQPMENASGLFLYGMGSHELDRYATIHGQSHSSWESDADYDGFDWGDSADGMAHWDNEEDCDEKKSRCKWDSCSAKTCDGGSKDRLKCTSNGDCGVGLCTANSCEGGSTDGQPCASNSDCGVSLCLCSSDNALCKFADVFRVSCNTDADCPADADGKPRECTYCSHGQPCSSGSCTGSRCKLGTHDGQLCTISADCPGGKCWCSDTVSHDLPFLNNEHETFQKWSRGCAGGPRDGLYCEADADCEETAHRVYYRHDVKDFEFPPSADQPECAGTFPVANPAPRWKCVAVERNFRHLKARDIFDLCSSTGVATDQDCREAIDANLMKTDPVTNQLAPDPLVLAGCTCPATDCTPNEASCQCAIDGGDREFYARNEYFRNDIRVDGTMFSYLRDDPILNANEIPDLGAYELKRPLPHYGPRPLGP